MRERRSAWCAWPCAFAALAVGAAAAAPGYLARGDEVEALHGELTARVAAAHDALRTTLESEAPDLAGPLRTQPPAALAFGYGMVPALSDEAKQAPAAEPAPRSYSWPRTREMIAGVERDVGALTGRLAALPAGPARRQALEELAGSYARIEANTRTAGEHVRYNRLWQGDVPREPERFARESGLIGDLLELRAIGRRIESAPPGPARAPLEERASVLGTELDALRRQREPCPFLRVERAGEGRFVLHVPVYTDVADAAFLAAAETAIEDAWRLSEDGFEARVDVELRRLAPDALYAPDAAPEPGSHLDLSAHVARFPGDGAVLTTGAETTHVLAARAIVLGSAPIARFVLAHEFGHVLGFRDGYLRGSRDLGSEGYEITELEIDPGDLMSSPVSGRVLRSHFEALVADAGLAGR